MIRRPPRSGLLTSLALALLAATVSARAPEAGRLVIGDTLAVGDTAIGVLGQSSDTARHYVWLDEGDTVDLAALSAEGSELEPYLTWYDPSGNWRGFSANFRPWWRGSPAGAVVPGFVADRSGYWRVDLRPAFRVGRYVVKVRSSGLVVATDPHEFMLSAVAAGATRTDTLWVYNAGRGGGSWTAEATGTGWLTVEPSGGSLAPGTERNAEIARQWAELSERRREALERGGEGEGPELERGLDADLEIFRDPDLAPAGAQALVVTIDAGALAQGRYRADVRIRPSDGWGGDAIVQVEARVTAPDVEVVLRGLPWRPWGVAVRPDGAVFATVARSVEQIDPATGARTPFVTDLTPYDWGLASVDAAADGTLYVADFSADAVHRIHTDGSVEVAASFGQDVEDVDWAPDGRVYVSGWQGVWAIEADGAVTTLLSGSGFNGVAYHPFDGWLYFTQWGALNRLDPVGGTVETVRSGLPAGAAAIEVGASGRIYLLLYDRLQVVTTSGELVESVWLPNEWQNDLALADGYVYLNGEDRRDNRFLRRPVSDRPIETGVAHLVAPTSVNLHADSLGVASATVEIDSDTGAELAFGVSWNASWLDVLPALDTTPASLQFVADASALAAGTYEDVVELTSGTAANSPLRIDVRLTASVLTVGSEVGGRLSTLQEVDTFWVDLAQDDRVDIGAFRAPGSEVALRLRVVAPNGSVSENSGYRGWWIPPASGFTPGAVLPSHHAPETGRYRIEVFHDCCSQPGDYVLKVRTPGAVAVTDPWSFMGFPVLERGPVVRDTIWVYNASSDALPFEITTTGEPWLSLSATSGTLPGASESARRAVAGASVAYAALIARANAGAAGGPAEVGFVYEAAQAPTGAVPIEVTLDPSGYAQGPYRSYVFVSVPQDDWAGSSALEIQMVVGPPDAFVVADGLPYQAWGLAYDPHPDGDLLMTLNRDVVRVNTATGGRTTVAAAVGDYSWSLAGLDVGPDGSIYVGTRLPDEVKRIRTDGTVDVLLSVAGDVTDVTVLPDGTVFAAERSGGIWRIATDGTSARMVTGAFYGGVVYNPFDGYVYYSASSVLARFAASDEPGAVTEERLPGDIGGVTDMTVGADGLLYLRREWGHDRPRVMVRRTNGDAVRDIRLPFAWDGGVAVGEGALYATTWDGGDRLWGVPVSTTGITDGSKLLLADAPNPYTLSRGQALVDTIVVTTSDGSAVTAGATWTAPWLTVSPDTADTPVEMVLGLDAAGLEPGRYLDSLRINSPDVVNEVVLPIELNVERRLALGDSVGGTFVAPSEVHEWKLDLVTGDTIDFHFSYVEWPGFPIRMRFLAPDGSTLWEQFSFDLVPSFPIDQTGEHRFAFDYPWGAGPAEYFLKVRSAGPILALDNGFFTLASPEGGPPQQDTIWLFNAGKGSLDWSAQTDGAPWLEITPSEGSLPAASPEALAFLRQREADSSPRGPNADSPAPDVAAESALEAYASLALAPPGAVPVVATVDFAGYAPGEQRSVVTFTSSDPWANDGIAQSTVDMRVYDARVTLVAQHVGSWAWGIEFDTTTGKIVMAPGDTARAEVGTIDLISLDPETGATDVLIPDVARYVQGARGLTYAPDGSLYLAESGFFKRIHPDGVVETLITEQSFYESSVAPDGTVFVAHIRGILRIDPDGTISTVFDDQGLSIRPRGVAYHPGDRMVYFSGTTTDALHRIPPEGGPVEHVMDIEGGCCGAAAYSIDVGASGHLYLATHAGAGLLVVSTAGEIVDEIWVPDATGHGGLALADGVVYGTVGSSLDLVWAVPVDDRRWNLAASNLVAGELPKGRVVPGGTTSAVMNVRASDGSALEVQVSWAAPWLSVDPTAATTPHDFTVTADASGLEPGLYEDTLVITADGAGNSPLERAVRLEVAAPLVAGDTVVFPLVPGLDVHSEAIQLSAGERVDLGTFRLQGNHSAGWWDFELEEPDGTRVFATLRANPEGWLIAGYRAPVSGLYRLVVYNWGSLSEGLSSELVLRTRPAGPTVLAEGAAVFVAAEGGAAQADTVWLYNTGSQSVTWELQSALPSWLEAQQTGGTLPGLSNPVAARGAHRGEPGTPSVDTRLIGHELAVAQSAEAAPPHAVPVVFNADPAGFERGSTLGAALLFGIVDDAWAGSATSFPFLRVYDPDFSIFTPFEYRAMDAHVLSATELLVTRYRHLYKVDRNTGAATIFAENLTPDPGSYPSPALGIDLGPDGEIYVADQTGRAVYRVEADGSVSMSWHTGETTYDPIVTSSGALYAATFQAFYRLEPDGRVVKVADDRGLKRAAFNPHDGYVYYVPLFGGAPLELKRLNPRSGEIEVVSGVPAWLLDIQVGASGKLYAIGTDRQLHVIGTDGSVESSRHAPLAQGFGVALGLEGEGILYGTGNNGPEGLIYTLPVADHRAHVFVSGSAVLASAPDARAARGQLVSVRVSLDVSATGKAVGSVQGTLDFDPGILRFDDLTSGFTGTFEPNTDSVADGRVIFGGINVDDAVNTGAVALLDLTFEVIGPWGAVSDLDLNIEEISATDFTDLSPDMLVVDGSVLVDPGSVALAVRGTPLSQQESKPFHLRALVGDLLAQLGSMEGLVALDPQVARVDSVTAGSFGGTLEWNGAMLADSGFVRLAVANEAPSAADSTDLAVVWLTAVEDGGDTTEVAWHVDELTERETFGSLLPFVSSIEAYRAGVSRGLWGDANGDAKITALDALICLSAVVGKSLPPEFDATACDVAPDNGVIFTGRVSALDALAILSHVVGKQIPAHFRVGDTR